MCTAYYAGQPWLGNNSNTNNNVSITISNGTFKMQGNLGQASPFLQQTEQRFTRPQVQDSLLIFFGRFFVDF